MALMMLAVAVVVCVSETCQVKQLPTWPRTFVRCTIGELEFSLITALRFDGESSSLGWHLEWLRRARDFSLCGRVCVVDVNYATIQRALATGRSVSPSPGVGDEWLCLLVVRGLGVASVFKPLHGASTVHDIWPAIHMRKKVITVLLHVTCNGRQIKTNKHIDDAMRAVTPAPLAMKRTLRKFSGVDNVRYLQSPMLCVCKCIIGLFVSPLNAWCYQVLYK